MGLLTTEINELRQLLKNFKAGKVSAEDLNAQINLYNQTEKRARLILTAWTVAVKHKVASIDAEICNEIIGSEALDTSKEPYNRTKDRGKK